MLPNQCQVALKEWAVTVRALAQGQQTLLLRKGGIHEGSKDFRVVHPEFLLYPTFEHQREDLLQPDYQPGLRYLLDEPRNSDQIVFSHWAKVEELIEISEQDKVDSLSPHFIWTKEYGGCTSWVDILDRVNLDGLQPVLSDAEFGQRVEEIKGSLGRAVATT